MTDPHSYADAGVDLQKVRRIHAALARSLTRTFAFRRGMVGAPIGAIGHYAGLIDIGGGMALAMHTDGVGSKVLVAQMMNRFDTVGVDCVAMTVNDLVCVGAEPVALLDYIALERENDFLVGQVVKGLVRGARESSTAIVGGETAILGDVITGVGGNGFDLAAMGVGLVARDRILDGSKVERGDVVVGVASSGLHSNGYTLARKVLLRSRRLVDMVPELGRTLGDELLTPTRVYVRPALRCLSRHGVHGLAHITGGAFSKLSRLTGKRRLSFALTPPPGAPIFEMIQQEGHLSDREMYRTFNMGVGLCVISASSEADAVMKEFRRRRFGAFEMGRVVEGVGVRIGPTRVA